jgi:AraC-like DNA-binding protein
MHPSQIVRLLRSTVIPWTAPDKETAIVMAETKMRSSDLPVGVTLSRRKIIGERVVVKNKRTHGNQRVYIAEWPEANLQELAIPKLACIISGFADYLLGDCYVHCGAGAFILMPPHIPHQRNAPNLAGERLRNGSCALLHAYAYQHGVHFWYSRSVNDQHFNEFADNYLIPSISAVQILHLLMNEAAEKKPHFESVASGLLATFFAIIAREIEAGNYMHPGPKENVYPPTRPIASFAEQIQEYLEANCHKVLKVEDAATHMYMSKSQFSRRILQETGVTFVELLTRIRIERAQQMLRETDLTFTSIAGSLSFRSFTHFHAIFYSRVGCTPIEYRYQTHHHPRIKK